MALEIMNILSWYKKLFEVVRTPPYKIMTRETVTNIVCKNKNKINMCTVKHSLGGCG